MTLPVDVYWFISIYGPSGHAKPALEVPRVCKEAVDGDRGIETAAQPPGKNVAASNKKTRKADYIIATIGRFAVKVVIAGLAETVQQSAPRGSYTPIFPSLRHSNGVAGTVGRGETQDNACALAPFHASEDMPIHTSWSTAMQAQAVHALTQNAFPQTRTSQVSTCQGHIYDNITRTVSYQTADVELHEEG